MADVSSGGTPVVGPTLNWDEPVEAGTVLHDRYVISRRLGRGEFGVVYAAEDRRYEREVAVKVLRRSDPQSAYALKREFRVLRGLRHPHLVQLYDLYADRPPFIFSMELVSGVDLVVDAVLRVRPPGEVVAILRQIADGVGWLHEAGLVHGDIKASNVRVRPDGCVVLCDFGLAGTVLGSGTAFATRAAGGGTSAYLAPESLDALGPGSVAADWYAVGVLFFEMLTGRKPFPGAFHAMRSAKAAGQIDVPRGAHQLDPAHERLIRRLLDPDPDQRGGLADVRALVGAPDETARRPRVRPPLVGREAELGVLREALASTRTGQAAVIELRGPSGIGKSALLEAFASELTSGDGVALSSTCHVNEHLPLNAFDGVVDDLARLLEARPDLCWPELATPFALGAAALFPALARSTGPRRADDVRHGAERRLRGIEAFRQLLSRVADQTPTLVVIDDAQWADADSRALLRLFLAPPAAPAVLLVLGVRSDLVEGSLKATLLADEAGARWPEWTTVTLGPLSNEATAELVRLADPEGEWSERAISESGGHPFLAIELARFRGRLTTGPVDLATVLRSRIAGLSRLERGLLEVCAVAGDALPPRVALAAAGVGIGGYPTLLALQGAQVLVSVGDLSDPQVDVYHHLLRMVALDDLPEARRRQLHLLVADAALLEGIVEPGFLTGHLEAAGDDRRAAVYASAAAGRAMDALAFATAAHFYDLAIRLRHSGISEPELRRAQAAALALAGQGVAAAEAYAAAAALQGPGLVRVGLEREAAEQWLRGGRADLGRERLGRVLEGLGLRWPATILHCIWAILSNRARLRLFGVKWVERVEAEADPELLARTDATWSATIGMNMLDLMVSAAFQAAHTRFALQSGEPGRVARALSVEAVYMACEGGASNRAFADGLYAQAHALADRTGNQMAVAFANLTHGAAEVFVGRPDHAFAWLEAAEVALRRQQVGVVWEVVNCRMYRAWAWWWRGDYARLVETIPALAIDARSRGDTTAEVALASGVPNFTWLVLDDPEEARARTAHAVAGFPESQFGSPHYFDIVARVNVEIYTGNGELAWRLLVAAWPRLRRILLLNMQYFRIHLTLLRAVAALAAGPVARPDALRQVRALAAEDHPFGKPLAAVLSATDPAALRAAIPALDAVGLGGFSAAARHRLGEDAGWGSQRVVNADRLCQTLLPLPPQTPGA